MNTALHIFGCPRKKPDRTVEKLIVETSVVFHQNCWTLPIEDQLISQEIRRTQGRGGWVDELAWLRR